MQALNYSMRMSHPFANYAPTFIQPPKPPKKTSPAENNSDSQSFQPQYHQIKKLGLKVNKKKICTGGWSSMENQVYLQFMMENAQDFLTEKARRKTKVFYRLSKILRKRTPDQCRSHHQKLQLKYKDDLYAIMSQVQRKIQRSIAEEYVNEQHRLQQQNLEQMKLVVKTSVQPDQCERMIEGGWYSVRMYGSSFKFEIAAPYIAEW